MAPSTATARSDREHASRPRCRSRWPACAPQQGSVRLDPDLTTDMATSRNGTILVVDDEEIMREILETLLTREGYDVRLAASGGEGLELARALPFDAAIVDIMMPGINGIETLDELKRIDEDLAVIILTAYASVESAISAMKAGAFDYITKPFKNDEVLVVVRNAMERRRLVHENRNLRQNIQERYHKFANIIGRSPRKRQGAGGQGDPRELLAIGSLVRHRQFGQPAAGPARVDAVRARQGRVHRGGVSEEGHVRSR